MQRERRRAGRAIRKARREQRERYASMGAHPDFRRQREMLDAAAVDFGRIVEGVGAAIAQAVDALATFARALVAEVERSAAPFVAYYRLAVFEQKQREFRDRLAFRALEPIHVRTEGYTMPPGLSYDTRTGILSGTPTAAGVFRFPVPGHALEDTVNAKGSEAT